VSARPGQYSMTKAKSLRVRSSRVTQASLV
jgi:hypothetical protein